MDNQSFAIVVDTIRTLAREKQLPKRLAERESLPETLLEDLGMDSLGQLKLISEIEDKTDRIFSESELSKIDTLEDLVDVVSKLLSQ